MLVRNKTLCFCISSCISLNNVQERAQSHLGSIAVELGSKGFCLFELFEAILINICCTLTKSHMFFLVKENEDLWSSVWYEHVMVCTSWDVVTWLDNCIGLRGYRDTD